MRKPDPVPPPPGTSKRSSTSAAHEDPPPLSSRSSSSNTADADPEYALSGTTKRKKSRAYALPDDEDESDDESDVEDDGVMDEVDAFLEAHDSGLTEAERELAKGMSLAWSLEAVQ